MIGATPTDRDNRGVKRRLLAAVIGLFNYFNRFNDCLHVSVTPQLKP